MPGSLLGFGKRVTRHESTRSDRSDASAYSSDSRGSAKKVSFNRAVRVKKFPQRKLGSSPPAEEIDPSSSSSPSNGRRSPSPEKRFWFKVYKNRHRDDAIDGTSPVGNGYASDDDEDVDSGHFGTLTTISETADAGTQTAKLRAYSSSSPSLFPLQYTAPHPSQMPPEPPRVKKDHVRKIVDQFNEDSVLRGPEEDLDGFYYDDDADGVRPLSSPPPPPPPQPPNYAPGKFNQRRGGSPVDGNRPPKSRKNPIINGVKVIFGMSNLKKRSGTVETKNANNVRKSQGTSTRDDLPNGSVPHRGPYSTNIVIPSRRDEEVQTNSRSRRRNKESNGGLVRAFSDDVLLVGEDPPYAEKWSSGDQLVLDTNDFHTESEKTDEGQFYKTVGEKHQVWRNETRTIVYEDLPPVSSSSNAARRKAKSYNDLSGQDSEDHRDHQRKLNYKSDNRGVSSEQLYSRQSNGYVNQRDIDHRYHQYNHKDDIHHHRGSERGTSTEQLFSHSSPSYVNQRYPMEDVHHRGSSTEQVYYQKSSERRSNSPAYVNQQVANGTSDTLRKKKKTRDQGVQCSKKRETDRVVRSKEGHVSGYSDIPTMDSWTEDKNGVIYSQVDKSKKKGKAKNRKEEAVMVQNASVAPSYVNGSELGRQDEKSSDRKVKTSRSIFGFKLKTSQEGKASSRDTEDRDRNWYDVDTDLEAAERSRRGKDISYEYRGATEDGGSDVSGEASDLYRKNETSTPGSVIREMDYKKREISYENVPRPDVDREGSVTVGGGLWYREADEDYRREMAQSEVSYPAGSHVGNDRFYTIGRVERLPQEVLASSAPRAYTLDRRHLEEKRRNNNIANTSGIKILVNGEEVDDEADVHNSKRGSKVKGHRKHRQKDRDDNNPSSVQSDPLYVRGGLAAAYQARQRAAVKRSSSSATPGMINGYRVRTSGDRQHGLSSSAASGISSSDSDSARRRRTLVMYIPGVSHQGKQAEEGDRVSGASVARSQSMLSASRPAKYGKPTGSSGGVARKTRFTMEDEIMPIPPSSESKKSGSESKKQSDIRRRHSMPKDTKFPWLKWKIKGKPSREP